MTKDNVLHAAKFGGLAKAGWELIAPDEESHPLNLGVRLLREAKRLDGLFTEQADVIDADDELSIKGKQTRLRKAAEAHRAALSKLRALTAKIETARTAAAAKAKADVTPEDRLATLLEAQEIRRLLPDDSTLVFEAYSDAITAGDVATLDAIESAPRLWPGRPGTDQIASMKETRQAALSPKVNEEVGHLADALGDVTAALDTAEAEAVERGGLGTPDPVADMAAGRPERTITAESGDRAA